MTKTLKNLRFFSLIIVLLTSLSVMAADISTDVFTLDHQMSQMCEKTIKDNLRFEKGVKKIDVSLKENTITIQYEPKKTDTEKLIKAFRKIGFNAFVVNPENTADGSSKLSEETLPCHSAEEEICITGSGSCCDHGN